VLNRTKLAVAAILVLGVSSAASAASGGSPVGPTGQIFDGVNPVLHPAIFGRSDKAYDLAGFWRAHPRRKVDNR
jgi:hypothetical protein